MKFKVEVMRSVRVSKALEKTRKVRREVGPGKRPRCEAAGLGHRTGRPESFLL